MFEVDAWGTSSVALTIGGDDGDKGGDAGGDPGGVEGVFLEAGDEYSSVNI